MASALIEELKIVATEAKRSQIEDAAGISWAALAAEADPQGRAIGTLLVEAGAGGGGGGGEGRERGGGERGGRGGGGVGQREQREDPLATQPDWEIEQHTYIHTYTRRKTPRRRSRAEEKQVSGLVPRYLLPPSSRYVDMW